MKLFYYIKLFCFAALSLQIISCSMDIPQNSYDYLSPPVITNCYQDPNDSTKIIVEFIGYNDEYYFDGYNVYVSNTSFNSSAIASYKPVYIAEDGYASATPSYPLSPYDYDPDLTRKITLYHYWISNEGAYEKYPFSAGIYYVILCSHHSSQPVLLEGVSNQVSVQFQ